MSYHFKPDEEVQAAVRRIGASQLDKAIGALEEMDANPEEAIHAARRHGKKLRALVRLVRPSFSGYGQENKAFRDAARHLSGVRDGTALVEALEKLIEHSGGEAGDAEPLLKRLRAERDERLQHLPKADSALALLREARGRCADWKVDGHGFDALEKGLKKTYQRARKGYRNCRRDPSAERLHDWRKRVKYHGYHVRLLGALWSPMSEGQHTGLSELAHLLGEHHDLENLREWLKTDELAAADEATLNRLLALAGQRQQELSEDALASGCMLLALKPKDLMAVFARWWKASAEEN